jgi:AraC family transcriptional regulator, regulatory protein of adaptative response / methylated-DNA-[protein]-cysteine methyltransferase
MNTLSQLSKDYVRIERAIHFLEEHADRNPSLREVANAVGMSEYHFQRVFQRWAGISPKQFLQCLKIEYAKELLKKSSILEASYGAGLSGPGRMHDLFITCEAMSPGEYKNRGQGLEIDYGFHPTPFGECFIAVTGRGICALKFGETKDREEVLRDFREDWKNAKLNRSQAKTRVYVERIFSRRGKDDKVRILCRGTNLQVKVWEALLRIPSGQVVSYQTVANAIEHPRAVRAVASAIGKNAVAYLIPCHRVIRGLGHMGGYRWGISRKKAMLAREMR